MRDKLHNMFQKSIVSAVLLGILFGASAVLGFKLVELLTARDNSRKAAARQDAFAGEDRVFPREITEAEHAALRTPPEGASEEEKRQHFDAVVPLATRAQFLDITRCLGDPIVFEVFEGETFMVRNNDDADHTIQISRDTRFVIPAGGELGVNAEFGFGPGVYGYGCDNSAGAAGIFLVTPPASK